MLRLIALQGVRAHENMEHYQAGKTLYIRDQAVKQSFNYNWKTKNKSCKIMWRLNSSTCIRYILVVCVIQPSFGTLYLHRDFTGVRGNLNAMKHSIKLCLLQGAENIYEQTSALRQITQNLSLLCAFLVAWCFPTMLLSGQ